MEKYKDSDVELMSILLKLQEQTSPIRMSIGYTVGGTVRQGIILYEAAPKVIETLIEKGYTLYRYTKAYLEASAWADKLEKEDGAGREFFKVLCLCRKPKETGCFPSIKPEVKQVIKNIWFNEDFARNQGTREMLYEKLTAIANINKWEKIPSYQTVTRYISYLMEDEGMRNAWFLASRGTREYKNKVMVKGSRDTKGLQVMQIVMGDEHTFDCWVSYKQPNGKVIAIKPHLAAWVDMRSRVIMGDVMCKDANSDILKQSLLKMIYSEPGGVPEYLYIDNGKDYTAKTMTGRDRNDRSGMSFDNETMGFYKSIGIKDDHRALPYEPWSKGQIERFFRTVCNKFTRWMKSYTGMGSMQVTLQSLRRRSESFLPLPEALLKVRNRRTAYLQEQANSRRRWSSLRAETLCRLLVCVRHVRSTWGLG